MSKTLVALPLTAERFSPYGDVIEAVATQKQAMNNARFERFNDLAAVDVGVATGGRTAISIARCRTATSFPIPLDMLERHPDSSQTFMPLSRFAFVVVVAPAGESVDPGEIAAFVSNGRQGINYHKGVWHMPMVATQPGQEFLVIDRGIDHGDDKAKGPDCEEYYLAEPILLEN